MIVWEDGTRKQRVYDMWQDNFHDPVSYADFYFEEVYGKNEILLNQTEEENVKGMLHLNPYTLRVKGQPVEAKYIVGVATDEEYRRQGVMRELLVKTFQTLRDRGEMFTYLMPADENYYLPFDFRFGMAQIEQELEYLPEEYNLERKSETAEDCMTGQKSRNTVCQNASQKNETEYIFKTEISDEQLEQIITQENGIKDTVFDIHTEITVPYIRRMEKEVESDYGQVLYVFDGESYVGRVAVGAEDSYFVLSQVFCAEASKREAFLEETILYCEKKYHYNRYQLILDPSWKDVATKIGLQGSFRYMPAKRVKKIMFRLLNIEGISKFLKSKADDLEADIYIEDNYLEEQSGIYHFQITKGNVSIVKKNLSKEDNTQCISIAALTDYLFGGEAQGIEENNTLTVGTKELFKNICPLSENCIMEIV